MVLSIIHGFVQEIIVRVILHRSKFSLYVHIRKSRNYHVILFLLTLATIPEPFFFLFQINGSNLVCSFGVTLLNLLIQNLPLQKRTWERIMNLGFCLAFSYLYIKRSSGETS